MTDNKQGLQGRAAGEAMVASIYDTFTAGGGVNDLFWKFAARVYPQQPWIGDTMRAALAGDKNNCPHAAVEMFEAVVAEADRRKESRLADTFRKFAGLMRSEARRGE
jgi:hypothetical protein